MEEERTIEIKFNETTFILILFLVGFILIFLRVSKIKEDLMVEEMERICEEEYHRSYYDHDSWFFRCINNSINSTLDIVQIQYHEGWRRPFEHTDSEINLS